MLSSIAFHLLSFLTPSWTAFSLFPTIYLFLCLLTTELSELPIPKSQEVAVLQLQQDEGFEQRSERSQLPGQLPVQVCFLLHLCPGLVPLHNFIYFCLLFPICKITECLGNKGTEMKTNYYYCLFLTNAQGLKPLNGSNSFFPLLYKEMNHLPERI